MPFFMVRMSKTSAGPPRPTKDERSEREQRRATALRENLHRRKAQARARRAATSETKTPPREETS
jgi:hypothetical protein